MILKFRKKPVVIEAIQFIDDSNTVLAIQAFMNTHLIVSYKDPLHTKLLIETLEGTMEASVNDWVIKGVNGEFYPCKPDIFEKTYEKV